MLQKIENKLDNDTAMDATNIYDDVMQRDVTLESKSSEVDTDSQTNRQIARGGKDHNNADPSLPSATSRFQSCRHWCMLARRSPSSMTFSIHLSRAFSSSGTKKEDKRERTLSKFACDDVM